MKYLKYLYRQFFFSRHFKNKLSHNFHELTWLERLFYILFVRPFWSRGKRFFFDGRWGLAGQMHIAERETLFNEVKRCNPDFCIEIGTHTGGGSTYFFSSAISDGSKLLTLESNPHYFNKVSKYYNKHVPELNKKIEFVFGDKMDMLTQKINPSGGIGCVLLDGSDDGTETANQFMSVEPYCHVGSLIILHDWLDVKTDVVRKEILQKTEWKLVKEILPPFSVGMAVFEKVKQL